MGGVCFFLGFNTDRGERWREGEKASSAILYVFLFSYAGGGRTERTGRKRNKISHLAGVCVSVCRCDRDGFRFSKKPTPPSPKKR
jgi:hypothetical protein